MDKTIVKDNWNDTALVWESGGSVFIDITEGWPKKFVTAGLSLSPKKSKALRKALKQAERAAKGQA